MDVKLNCNIAKKCNSCQLNNLSYNDQLKFKQSKCRKFLGSFSKIEPIIGMETPYAYRNKAQAVFKVERDKSIRWGLYKSTTNSVVVTKSCKLHTKHSNEIFDTLCKLFKSFKISVYNPYKGTGFIKSVVIREGFSTKECMVILNGADAIFPAKKTFVSALLKKHPYITTVVTTVNKDRKKLFIGKTQDILHGDGYITDVLCGKTFIISPQSFYQINPVQTQKLYEKAIELADLDGTQTVLDSYCGVGTIGICLCDKVKKVLAVESNEDAIKDARKNAKLNNITNVDFVCADAKDYIRSLKDDNVNIDVAIVDPPRSGCSKEFLHCIIDMNVKKIVYVSCNVETQSRDLKLLKSNGYKVMHIQPVDMFPHTNHVESIALLTKDDVTIRVAKDSDAQNIAQLMSYVYEKLEDKSTFVCDDLAFVKKHLNKNGFGVVACNENGEIVGSFILRFPHHDDDNLGKDINLSSKELQRVVHMESAVVHPSYRGKALQRKMLSYAEKLIDKEKYNILLATVSPKNLPSCKTFEQSAYKCVMTKEKYGGMMRNIYMKKL